MAHYNLDKLVRVSLHKSVPSSRYTYKTERKFWWFVTRKKGFYNDLFLTYQEECPKDYFLENGIVYTKPECELLYQNNVSKTYVFDTYHEALVFRDNIISKGNFIE